MHGDDVGNAEVEIGKLSVKVENLQQDHNELLQELRSISNDLLALRRDYDRMVNRGIGAGLIIGTLGGTGGYVLALIKNKLGFL